MPRRVIKGNVGHLMRDGGIECKVRTEAGDISALDLELRKESKTGTPLALVFYLYLPFVGWVREDRLHSWSDDSRSSSL